MIEPEARDAWTTCVVAIDADTTRLDVHVIPRAHRTQLAGTRDGVLLIRLAAPPVDDAANAELVHFLSSALGVARRAVTLVRGAKSRQKRVQVTTLPAGEVARRLRELVGGD